MTLISYALYCIRLRPLTFLTPLWFCLTWWVRTTMSNGAIRALRQNVKISFPNRPPRILDVEFFILQSITWSVTRFVSDRFFASFLAASPSISPVVCWLLHCISPRLVLFNLDTALCDANYWLFGLLLIFPFLSSVIVSLLSLLMELVSTILLYWTVTCDFSLRKL